MRGYYLDIGYSDNPEEAWKELRRHVVHLCAHPERIATEASRLGCPEELEGEMLADYAERYRDREDYTIFIQETALATLADPGSPYVVQFASGGGPGRVLKEHLRRAFCRLVIEHMHRQGIEVNLRVSCP